MYWKKKGTRKKKCGKPGCACTHPFRVTSGSPIGHAQWYLYYSTNCGKNYVTKEKRGNYITSGHVTDVTSDQGSFRSRDWRHFRSGPLPVT